MTQPQTMEESPRNGDWILTYSGKAFYPTDPREADICIQDIAHALSMECRYGGHSRFHYSVAQHSVLLHDYCKDVLQWGREACFYALMHDASEAYCKDIPRPLKAFMPDYRAIEALVDATIVRKFMILSALDPQTQLQLKQYDTRITLDEYAVMMKPGGQRWAIADLEPLGIKVSSWQPGTAKYMFLNRARKYLTEAEMAE